MKLSIKEIKEAILRAEILEKENSLNEAFVIYEIIVLFAQDREQEEFSTIAQNKILKLFEKVKDNQKQLNYFVQYFHQLLDIKKSDHKTEDSTQEIGDNFKKIWDKLVLKESETINLPKDTEIALQNPQNIPIQDNKDKLKIEDLDSNIIVLNGRQEFIKFIEALKLAHLLRLYQKYTQFREIINTLDLNEIKVMYELNDKVFNEYSELFIKSEKNKGEDNDNVNLNIHGLDINGYANIHHLIISLINRKDKQDQTLIDKFTNILEFLLLNGQDINFPTKDKQSPLQLLCKLAHKLDDYFAVKIATTLISKKANVHYVSQETGATVLSSAMLYSPTRTKLQKFLIAIGATAKIKDDNSQLLDMLVHFLKENKNLDFILPINVLLQSRLPLCTKITLPKEILPKLDAGNGIVFTIINEECIDPKLKEFCGFKNASLYAEGLAELFFNDKITLVELKTIYQEVEYVINSSLPVEERSKRIDNELKELEEIRRKFELSKQYFDKLDYTRPMNKKDIELLIEQAKVIIDLRDTVNKQRKELGMGSLEDLKKEPGNPTLKHIQPKNKRL